MEEEIKILHQIEELIKKNHDQLLMEVVPADCKCKGQTKKVFRCPGAFEINVLLSTLVRLRNGEYRNA
jgi:6,7-dimethyl-8-ribityllumazine synthase